AGGPATAAAAQLGVGGVAARLGRRGFAVRGKEALAAGADPADPLRGTAGDEGEMGAAPGHDAAGPDHREPAHFDAGDDDCPGADRAAPAEEDRRDRPVVGPGNVPGRGDRPRVALVRQDRAGADEHAVLDGDAVVDEGEVLDLDAVADRDAL